MFFLTEADKNALMHRFLDAHPRQKAIAEIHREMVDVPKDYMIVREPTGLSIFIFVGPDEVALDLMRRVEINRPLIEES